MFLQSIADVAVAHGYKHMKEHIHQILLTTCLFQLVFVVCKPTFRRCSKVYRELAPKTRISFDIHVVSMVNCLVLLGLSFPLFWDPVLYNDQVRGSTPYTRFVSCVAAGYFLWDSLACLTYVQHFGSGFLLHGLLSFIVFLQGVRPYINYYIPVYLMFELSTPFVNVHWFASHLPPGTVPEPVVVVNGIFLMITFFASRLVWGPYKAIGLFRQIFSEPNWSFFPAYLPLFILASNLLLSSLNLYWFSKMLSLAYSKLSGHSKQA